MENRRVAITGLGVLAANGIGKEAFWSSLCEGRSGVSLVSRFDASQHRMAIAGEVKDFDPARVPSRNIKLRRVSRQTQFAVAACSEAMLDAGLDEEALRSTSNPVLLSVGTSTTAFEMVERAKEEMDQRGPGRVNPMLISFCQPNATAATLTEFLGVSCQALTFATACTAGLDAIKAAYDLISDGQCDIAIAGGTDALVTPLGMAGFWASGLLPDWQGEPHRACRPFDRDRRGGILAEGAGFVVLESLAHAEARGAKPYGCLMGFGASIDAAHTEAGSGFGEAIGQALANSSCMPTDMDYVAAHGPGDVMIDRLETEALKKQLGPHAYRIPVISIKGSTGNPLAAAGPLQLAACSLAMRHGTVPPTVNHEHADPCCDLDYNAGAPRSGRIDRALVNLHGMGGRNLCAVLERCGA